MSETTSTQNMLEDFDKLCEKYSCEDIEVKKLIKGIAEAVNNWSG